MRRAARYAHSSAPARPSMSRFSTSSDAPPTDITQHERDRSAGLLSQRFTSSGNSARKRRLVPVFSAFTNSDKAGNRLTLELVREGPPRLRHQTPSRSTRSLAEMSTDSEEGQVVHLPVLLPHPTVRTRELPPVRVDLCSSAHRHPSAFGNPDSSGRLA